MEEEREFVQLYREADEDVKIYLMDLLLCFVSCGGEFIEEIKSVSGDTEAMRAVVSKWLPTGNQGHARAEVQQ